MKQNEDLKQYLEEKLSHFKMAVNQKLLADKASMNEKLREQLDYMIAQMAADTIERNHRYVQTYNDFISRIAARRANNEPERVLSLMSDSAKRSLVRSLEMNQSIFFNYIDSCKKQLGN